MPINCGTRGKGDRSQPDAETEPDAVIDSVAGLPGLLQG
jgi:hypothetical protein